MTALHGQVQQSVVGGGHAARVVPIHVNLRRGHSTAQHVAIAVWPLMGYIHTVLADHSTLQNTDQLRVLL